MATTGYSRSVYINTTDYSAVASTAAEASLLGGVNDQPIIPALNFESHLGFGKWYRLYAEGVLSTTGTPTIVFQARANTTLGSSVLSGGSIGVTAAITTASGVTNKWWELVLDVKCVTPGIGTGNATMQCAGRVMSPGGFASPFIYPLEPTTPDTATWTQTFDGSLNMFINLSVTWGTSSASNTITAKKVFLVEMQ